LGSLRMRGARAEESRQTAGEPPRESLGILCCSLGQFY